MLSRRYELSAELVHGGRCERAVPDRDTQQDRKVAADWRMAKVFNNGTMNSHNTTSLPIHAQKHTIGTQEDYQYTVTILSIYIIYYSARLVQLKGLGKVPPL